MWKKIKNYLLLISRMSFSQLYYRVVKIIKFNIIYKKWGRRLYSSKIETFDYSNYKINSFHDWQDFNLDNDVDYKNLVLREANKVLSNKFTFLNETYKFCEDINWENTKDNDKLWMYYLNYFEYLLLLIEAYYLLGDKRYLIKGQELTDDWINNTYPGQSNSWEPYTISLRVINWSHLWEVMEVEEVELYAGFKDKMATSISQQANFLYSNLEKDLANNHYTANGKALFWMGVTFPFFEKAKKYLDKGIGILQKQLNKEIQKDGSQYENSTSYQLMTSKDYLEVLIYAKKNKMKLPMEFYRTTEKMFEYIMALMKPNKELPLLNDSIEGYPIKVNELLAIGSLFFKRGDLKYTAGDSSVNYLKNIYGKDGYYKYEKIVKEEPNFKSILLSGSNYLIFKSGWDKGDSYFLFDSGAIGPTHNSGHAHADNLSFYLHVNNENIFVDPGTYEYKEGRKRNYYRSTAAHNTIEVENQNQTTFWGAFRTGYIAKSEILNINLSSKKKSITAQHNGYNRLKQNVVHKRKAQWNSEKTWIIYDSLIGKGSIQGNIYFQVGLNCKRISFQGDKCILEFNNSNVSLKFKTKSDINILVDKGWISKEWKTEYPIKKIRVNFNDKLPIHIETIINVQLLHKGVKNE